MIDIKNLSFRYKATSRYAIRGASCFIESAGTTAIVGRSGIGKSTLMALISGIYTVRDDIVGYLSGTISVDGYEPEHIRGPDVVSWVPQQPALLDHLTVTQNIMLPLTIGGVTLQARANCERILESLDMREQKNARPRELSGGMRTRASLARALISRPRYLFLDEPFVSLDIANRWSMYKLLREERQGGNLCTLITTHDIPEAILLADRILLLGVAEGKTTIQNFENKPLELGGRPIEEIVNESRVLAPVIEREIYSDLNMGLIRAG